MIPLAADVARSYRRAEVVMLSVETSIVLLPIQCRTHHAGVMCVSKEAFIQGCKGTLKHAVHVPLSSSLSSLECLHDTIIA